MTTPDLRVVPEAAQRHGSLTIFPLTAPDRPELPYTLLAEALAAGTVVVTERGAGTVPELEAVNAGKREVLALDGEQLLGAKQNRTLNRTVLLPRGKTVLPVFCIEEGRWAYRSPAFVSALQHAPLRMKRKVRAHEATIVRSGHVASPDKASALQGEIWKEIAEASRALGGRSPTGALDAVFDAHHGDLESWLEHFPRLEGQVGVLAFLGEAPLGLDLLGGCRLYAQLHSQLLRGYVFEALWSAAESRGKAPSSLREPEQGDALRLLALLQRAERTEVPTVGVGSYRVLVTRPKGSGGEEAGALGAGGEPAGDEGTGAGEAADEGTGAGESRVEEAGLEETGAEESAAGLVGAELVHENRLVHRSAHPEEGLRRR